MQKGKYITIVFFIIGLISIVYYLFFGKSICLFYNIYGISSPSCGMTRAYIHLLKLDIKKAFYYHPLFWLVPFLIITYSYKNKKYFYFITTIFLLVWIIRLYMYFPNKEPFMFNENALIPRLYNKLMTR